MIKSGYRELVSPKDFRKLNCDEGLRQLQDESVKALMAKQEAHGLSILTDGEFRRLNFQDSFLESVAGFVPKKQPIQFQERRTVGGKALQRGVPDSGNTDPALQYWRPIADRLRLARNIPLSESPIGFQTALTRSVQNSFPYPSLTYSPLSFRAKREIRLFRIRQGHKSRSFVAALLRTTGRTRMSS